MEYKKRGMTLKLSYNKLWKLLIDKNLNKQDLIKLAGISSSTIAKLGKGENVTTDVLIKICEALNSRVEDILETDMESENINE